MLKKLLYGLKQAPKQRYKKFNSYVQDLGFIKSNFDSYFLFKGTEGPDSIYLLLCVDDILLACHDRFELDLIKSKFKTNFETKDLGQVKRILGMEIKRDMNNCILYVNQCSYVNKVLEKFSIV